MLQISTTARRAAVVAMQLAAAGLAVAVLGACSWMPTWLHVGEQQDDAYDYRKAKTRQEPLEVPPDLSPLAKDERYAVPTTGTAKPAPAGTPAAGTAAGTAAAGTAAAGTAAAG